MKAKWVQKGKCASIHGTKTTKAVFEALTEKGILSAFSSAIKKPQIMPPLWCLVKLTNTQQNSLNGRTLEQTEMIEWVELSHELSCLSSAGGGGGVLLGILGGVCRKVLQILTRVSNQENVIFHIHFQTRPLYPCPFSDLAFRQKLCYRYLERKPKKYSNPFRIRIFLFLSSSFEIETINTLP